MFSALAGGLSAVYCTSLGQVWKSLEATRSFHVPVTYSSVDRLARLGRN